MGDLPLIPPGWPRYCHRVPSGAAFAGYTLHQNGSLEVRDWKWHVLRAAWRNVIPSEEMSLHSPTQITVTSPNIECCWTRFLNINMTAPLQHYAGLVAWDLCLWSQRLGFFLQFIQPTRYTIVMHTCNMQNIGVSEVDLAHKCVFAPWLSPTQGYYKEDRLTENENHLKLAYRAGDTQKRDIREDCHRHDRLNRLWQIHPKTWSIWSF